MKHKVIKIDQTECDHLEGIQVEVESMKQLIAFAMSTTNPYPVDPVKLAELTTQYKNKFYEYQVLMSALATKYKPKEFSDNADFNIVFATATMTFTDK